MQVETKTDQIAERLEDLLPAEVSGPLLSRRRWLLGGGLAGAILGRAPNAQAGGGLPERHALDDQAPRQESPELKLIRRITMGLNEEELERMDRLGYQAYLEYHLDHEAIDDDEVEADLDEYYLTLNRPVYNYRHWNRNLLITELIQATIFRSVHSKKQLLQRMVEFWTDHFNIELVKDPVYSLKTVDDRAVIRPNALGTFPDILRASVKSPAMLVYLDNNTNLRGSPNENYARELLELHTLGVDGGYREADVVEFARCLTGWGTSLRADHSYGSFEFRVDQHDRGVKYVMGLEIYNFRNWERDVEEVVDFLVDHPSTMRFIALKMCRWMWGYEPPESLVDDVADIYAATGGDIRAMLRRILARRSMIDAPPKLKRPYHLIVSAIRTINGSVAPRGAQWVWRNALSTTGQIPYYWGPPDGYPDTIEHWIGNPLARWNILGNLASGNGQVTFLVREVFDGAETPEEIADRLDYLLHGGEMPASEKQALVEYMEPGPPNTRRKLEALGLAFSAPAYQLY